MYEMADRRVASATAMTRRPYWPNTCGAGRWCRRACRPPRLRDLLEELPRDRPPPPGRPPAELADELRRIIADRRAAAGPGRRRPAAGRTAGRRGRSPRPAAPRRAAATGRSKPRPRPSPGRRLGDPGRILVGGAGCSVVAGGHRAHHRQAPAQRAQTAAQRGTPRRPTAAPTARRHCPAPRVTAPLLLSAGRQGPYTSGRCDRLPCGTGSPRLKLRDPRPGSLGQPVRRPSSPDCNACKAVLQAVQTGYQNRPASAGRAGTRCGM